MKSDIQCICNFVTQFERVIFTDNWLKAKNNIYIYVRVTVFLAKSESLVCASAVLISIFFKVWINNHLKIWKMIVYSNVYSSFTERNFTNYRLFYV